MQPLSGSGPLLAVLLLCAGGVSTLRGQEAANLAPWGQWRGPTRDARLPADTPPWPEKLDDTTLRLAWQLELGPSYSGPIVSADTVFTTETVDEKDEVASAYDRFTGERKWRTSWPGSLSVFFIARANGDWIRATPAYDPTTDKLFVAGMRDFLVCLDAKTGAKQWTVDFTERLGTPLPGFGYVSSPLADGNAVYTQAGGAVVRLDTSNGAIVWRALETKGTVQDNAFSSPTLTEIAGVRQLVVQTRAEMAGLDPTSGKVLWSFPTPAFQNTNVLTPLKLPSPAENAARFFTSAYGAGSVLIEVTRTGDDFQAAEVWRNRSQGYMSSPVLIDDVIYLHLRNQRFACIDAATGEERWRTRPFGKYWSMVANGDAILALDQDGTLRRIRATPEEFVLLDERTVTDETAWAHLAVAGRQVLVRSLYGLEVYDWTTPVGGSQ